MNKKDHKTYLRDKQNLETRLVRRQYEDQPDSMFKDSNIHYQIAERTRAIGFGGIGALHKLVCRLGLDKAINKNIVLLQRHVPYWESDHVLHLSYNVLTGGTCLQDLARLREDAGYLDALGVDRLPHPTTSGDFLRRFTCEESLLGLQEAINGVRTKVWKRQPASFRKQAIIDVDGTHAATLGECKQDIGLSHKGIWGYAPLILSLSGTREVLYIVNRPGNVVSHEGAVDWIDRAIALTQSTFQQVWLRGDTDFSLTAHFDRWDAMGVRFVFGLDAMPNLVEKAQALPQEAWEPLERPPAYQVKTHPRQRPPNVKAQIVRQKGFKNITLMGEDVAVFSYQPIKCRKAYRVVVLRKQLRITRGDVLVEQTVRYLFYITNDPHKTPAGIVAFSNDRCDQENHIEQLKNGVGALRCPTGDLCANGAYMIIATLAWNLKAWYGLLMPNRMLGWQVVRMEFKRFLWEWIRLPAQVLRTARRFVLRLLKRTWNTQALLDTFGAIQHIRSP